MKTHHLKIWPQWFDAIRLGSKSYEIRYDDRGFNVGDRLVLEEFKAGVGEYTGRTIEKRVVYISRGDDAEAFGGLREGYAVLGIGPCA
jgi:hypothetical protein